MTAAFVSRRVKATLRCRRRRTAAGLRRLCRPPSPLKLPAPAAPVSSPATLPMTPGNTAVQVAFAERDGNVLRTGTVAVKARNARTVISQAPATVGHEWVGQLDGIGKGYLISLPSAAPSSSAEAGRAAMAGCAQRIRERPWTPVPAIVRNRKRPCLDLSVELVRRCPTRFAPTGDELGLPPQQRARPWPAWFLRARARWSRTKPTASSRSMFRMMASRIQDMGQVR